MGHGCTLLHIFWGIWSYEVIITKYSLGTCECGGEKIYLRKTFFQTQSIHFPLCFWQSKTFKKLNVQELCWLSVKFEGIWKQSGNVRGSCECNAEACTVQATDLISKEPNTKVRLRVLNADPKDSNLKPKVSQDQVLYQQQSVWCVIVTRR